MKTERGKGAAEEKTGARRGCFMDFKEQSHLHNRKVQDETESAGPPNLTHLDCGPKSPG